MCCVFTILLFFGPRLGILIWWLLNPRYVGFAFPNWILGILGWLFLPWTTLMYILIYPGGVVGFDWVWIGLAVVADIASYGGGGYGNRDRLRGR